MSSNRHPDPALPTVKRLYASASACGHPDCERPLFEELDGLWVLTSRIAHICAASPGGPRWDAKMTPEENAAFENLILLCSAHADLIDSHSERYDVETLHEWKANLGVSKGVEITDEQATTAIKQSLKAEMITLRADVINVGGSSGGGGGAIGRGAVGGRGGDQIWINLDAEPSTTPGQGGAGGGAIAEGASVVPPDAIRAKIGRVWSDGYDGNPGGDSSFGDLLADRGGEGAKAGTGKRAVTEHLQVSSFVPFNSAEIREELFYVLGGGWTRMRVLNIPSSESVHMLAVVEAGGAPIGEYSLHVWLTDPLGKEARVASFPVTVTVAGELARVLRFLSVQCSFDSFGMWSISVRSDVAELASYGFAIERVTDPQPEL